MRCNICRRKNIQSSRMLPCCHTFCEDCLNILSHSPTICCPACKKTSKTPKSINHLKRNRFLEKLTELKSKFRPRECDNCGEKVVANYCKTCKQHFCNDCTIETHSMHKAMSSHDIFNVVDYIKEVKREKFKICPKHDEPIKLYCERCREYICETCCQQFRHAFHSLEPIEKKLLGEKKSIESEVADQNYALDCFENELKSLDLELNDDGQKFVELVEKRRDQLKEELDEDAQLFIGKIRKYFNARSKCYASCKKITMEKKDTLECNIQMLTTRLNGLNYKSITEMNGEACPPPTIPQLIPVKMLLAESNVSKVDRINWTPHIGSWEVSQTKIVFSVKE